MFDGKFIVTLVALMAAIFTIANSKVAKEAEISEGFGMLPSFQTKAERVEAASPAAAAKGQFFSVPGNYQSILNPRFSNVDYGASVRYNMPSYKNQAVPCEPLTFSNMAKENYSGPVEGYGGCSSCDNGCSGSSVSSSPGIPGGVPPTESGYAAGNYNKALESAYSGSNIDVAPSASLPVANMSALNAAGESVQPIVYDRYIYANRNSRLRSQGDPIRGDLPIVPCASDWFRPSVSPNLDLQQGAMTVMGGFDNDTSTALASLMYNASGNSQTTAGGVNMARQLETTAGSGLSSINVSSFV